MNLWHRSKWECLAKSIRLEELTYRFKFQIAHKPTLYVTLDKSLHFLGPVQFLQLWNESLSRSSLRALPSLWFCLSFLSSWKDDGLKHLLTLSRRTRDFMHACLSERVHSVRFWPCHLATLMFENAPLCFC